ncbi:hypothetical protein F5888DRAFT_1713468 [Russula emetica]|nr:hypothetical protein F5888DRAFT_1713468 [Russula emetica]
MLRCSLMTSMTGRRRSGFTLLPCGSVISQAIVVHIPSNRPQAKKKSQATHSHNHPPLTYLWIRSTPSSLSPPSPLIQRPKPRPPSPSMPMAAQTPIASLLRGHSSSTGASYPSSAASVSVPFLLHLCLSSLQHYSSLASTISFFFFRYPAAHHHFVGLINVSSTSFFRACRISHIGFVDANLVLSPFCECINLFTITIFTVILRQGKEKI